MYEGFVGIKIPPLFPDKFVVGSQNREINGVTTEQGRRFFLQLVNLMQGSFGLVYEGEESEFADLLAGTQHKIEGMFPGLSFETSPQKARYVDYLDTASRRRTWAEAGQVDFDLDGTVDAGRTIEDGVPYDIYLKRTSTFSNKDGRDSGDFSEFLKGVRASLPDDQSYGEIIGSGDYRGLDTEAGFNLFSSILQFKRNYIYAMNTLGMDVNEPNREGAIDRFNEVVNSWKIKESGNYNDQLLWHYLNMRPDIAGRLGELMGAEGSTGTGRGFYDWVKSDVLPGYKRIFRDRIRAVDIHQDRVHADTLRAQLAELRSYLDPATSRLIIDEEHPERMARAVELISGLRDSLNSISSAQRTINREMSIVPGKLTLKVAEFAQGLGGLNWPSAIDETTDFGGILTGIDDLLTAGNEIDRLQTGVFDHPDTVIDNLFKEYSVESRYSSPSISQLKFENMGDEFKATVRKAFDKLNQKPLGYSVGFTAVNGVNGANNKRIDTKKNEKKTEEYLDQVAQRRAEEKSDAQRKTEVAAANKPKPKENKNKVSKKGGGVK